MDFNKKRCRILNENKTKNKNILYYINSLRIEDNWAIIYSINLANNLNSKCYLVFNVFPNFLNSSIRHYSFLYEGLQELEKESEKYNISFNLLYGDPILNVKKFIQEYNIGYLIIEQQPLKLFKELVEKFKTFDINIHQIDVRNIFPVWIISDHKEYSARTLRIKINKNKNEFLTEFPELLKCNNRAKNGNNNFDIFLKKIIYDKNVKQIKDKDKFIGGYKNGMKQLQLFLTKNIKYYNNFIKSQEEMYTNSSRLSFWIHFGMISSQRCVLEAQKIINSNNKKQVERFIEQIMVRKELSDNFCYYENNYTSFDSGPNWAKKTLDKHINDKRNIIYTLKDLENYKTEDQIWNMCQKYMIDYGYLFGILRIYWAKKVLQWCKSHQEAIDTLVYLNDKYFIDGRDPNGYVGIMWSIMGLHDRPFFEREIYGTIRLSGINSVKKQIDIKKFILN